MIDLLLLLLLVVIALVAVRVRDLLSSAILLSAYSLLMAVVWTRLNAVDVAFTEAAVGAGITTVLLVAALTRTAREETGSPHRSDLSSLLVVLAVTALLFYGTLDMPAFGDPTAPTNVHVIPRYLEHGVRETGVINFVTGILAYYRGYDTLGETTVIFTAGICVVLLLRQKLR
jgi:multicomponent Na+:H+ antiporter subunit B